MSRSDQHLRDSIEYLQDRLEFVNDKANIFIAIQTGLFVGVAWVFGDFFLPLSGDSLIKQIQIGFLILNIGFIIVVVSLLLQTIRPSESYFSLRTGVTPLESESLMWPNSGGPDADKFQKKVSSITPNNARKELASTVYVLHQLVDETYRTYRWSILVMKIQVIVILAGFALLLICDPPV